MHFKKISIEFDGEWILRHRLSKKLPINTFIDKSYKTTKRRLFIL